MKSYLSLLSFCIFSMTISLYANNTSALNALPHFEENITFSEVQFYVSSSSSSSVSVFDKLVNDDIEMSSFTSAAMEADGIAYDKENDVLYQLNTAENVIHAYSGVRSALAMGVEPMLTATSSSDFSNGKKIGFYNGKIVVAQDRSSSNDGNQFIIYDASATSITLDKKYDATINLNRIYLDGNTLFAVLDNSNRVAVYEDFFSKSGGRIFPSSISNVEGATFLGGVTYVSESDMLLLTDLGDTSDDSDGSIIRVRNFTKARADTDITMDEQIKVGGGSSLLGNPLDIAYDRADQRVYIAEGLRNGGMMLCYKLPVISGGIGVEYSAEVPGASSISFTDSGFFPCETITAGSVSLPGGGSEATILIDGIPDVLSFVSKGATTNTEFTYVVTDEEGFILGIPPANMVDFDPAGTGACIVYGLSYVGDLNIALGDDLFAEGIAIASDCVIISDNSIRINRIEAGASDMRIYTSSNTSGQIGVYSVLEDLSLASSSFASGAADADGIFYDEINDVLYQLNRTDNRIDLYGDVKASFDSGSAPSIIASSSSDFSNGREIAVVDNKLIVAQDASDSNDGNKLVVYDITPTGITYDKEYTVDIDLWGIFATGNTLYAVEDNSSNVAVYSDFFNMPAGALTPSNLVMVEDMVRTHGIVYNFYDDIMVLTDIGDAESDENDGAVVVIRNFNEVSADGFVSADEQARAFGGASQLANPVDITYDRPGKLVYVAERKKNGGMIYAYKLPKLTGGIFPEFATALPGGSAVHLPGLEVGICEIANGGEIALSTGGQETTIIVDNKADEITFVSSIPEETVGFTFTYVITDENGIVLGLPQSNVVDFNGAGTGTCYVYGFSYVGDLNLEVGDDLFAEGVELATGCNDLSDERLTINRVEPQRGVAYLFASSSTENQTAAFNILADNGLIPGFFYNPATDAAGLSFDTRGNVLYQVNRSTNTLDAITGVDAFISSGATPSINVSSMEDFTNGGEVAAIGDKLVVVDPSSGGSKLLVYDASPLGISLDKIYETEMKIGGIAAEGGILHAVEDGSNMLASFRNFLSNDEGMISPTSKVMVEGLTSLRGIDFDRRRNRMFLTDLGVEGNDEDGAIVFISRWRFASLDDTISSNEQVKIQGDSTLLGDPVDVVFDVQGQRIYVAESANNEGRLLGFNFDDVINGENDPAYIYNFHGISSVEISDPIRRNTEIVSTDRNLPQIDAKLYPSPASETINLVLDGKKEGNFNVQILDMTGKLVHSEQIHMLKGENTFSFNITGLSSGFHIVKIPRTDFADKFLKIR